mgnify:CR=1 FL=1
MPSLRQLLDTHATLLLLDAASSRIQVGLLSRHHETRWASADTEAGTGIFACVEQLAINPTSVSATIFCSGPGSILGIRTSAMAIRTWNMLSPRATYSYHSLKIVAAALQEPETSIIADARRERWHVQTHGEPIRQVDASALSGRVLIPERFRHWSALPEDTATTPYNIAELLPKAADAPLFQPTENPDAYIHTEPTYKKWEPQIHRTP